MYGTTNQLAPLCMLGLQLTLSQEIVEQKMILKSQLNNQQILYKYQLKISVYV